MVSLFCFVEITIPPKRYGVFKKNFFYPDDNVEVSSLEFKIEVEVTQIDDKFVPFKKQIEEKIHNFLKEKLQTHEEMINFKADVDFQHVFEMKNNEISIQFLEERTTCNISYPGPLFPWEVEDLFGDIKS